MTTTKLTQTIALAAALFAVQGCEQKSTPPPPSEPSKVTTSKQQQLDSHFWQAGADEIDQLIEQSGQLQKAIDTFLSQTDESSLSALQQQWRVTHSQWHRCAFYLAGIERRPLLVPELAQTISRIHASPIEPGYIDAIDGYPNSGLINDLSVIIDSGNLYQQHQRFDLNEVAVGLHALEFMLWQRSAGDYSKAIKPSPEQRAEGLGEADMPSWRRRQYLKVLADALIQDSQQLQQQWLQMREQLASLPFFGQPKVYLALVSDRLMAIINHRSQIPEPSWQQAALTVYRQWLIDESGTVTDETQRERLRGLLDAALDTLATEMSAAEQRAALIKLLAEIEALRTPATNAQTPP